MRDYVSTRWGQVHLRREGTDGPGLVLLHESPMSSVVFRDVLPLLGRDFTTVAIDTPGYGLSDGPPEVAEIPGYATTILEAIDRIGLDNFAVAGSHTGASLAVQLAVQAPHRVTHAIFSGVPVFTPEERAWYLSSFAPKKEAAADGSHLAWAWERYQRIWPGPPELIHLGASTLLQNLDRYHIGYQAAFRYDPEPDLERIACPVLLYTGDEDLLIDSDRRAVNKIPDARLEVVPESNGQLPLRQPNAYAERIQRFILTGQ